jgi:hypothetical protein
VTEHLGPYRQESGASLIEIKLNSLAQVFNSLDPSPFHERDLDADAEDYIVGAARELPLSQPLKLVFHLPADHLDQAAIAGLDHAMHNYFAYREATARRELRFTLRQGRAALAIGLAFLLGCIVARQLVATLGHGAIAELAAEGLLIVGWVAMWRPLQIFLYDWWPIRDRARLFAKLAVAPVEARAWPRP